MAEKEEDLQLEISRLHLIIHDLAALLEEWHRQQISAGWLRFSDVDKATVSLLASIDKLPATPEQQSAPVHWRTGTKVPFTLYRNNEFAGSVRDAAHAKELVRAVNIIGLKARLFPTRINLACPYCASSPVNCPEHQFPGCAGYEEPKCIGLLGPEYPCARQRANGRPYCLECAAELASDPEAYK
jgi:hypothetical protein